MTKKKTKRQIADELTVGARNVLSEIWDKSNMRGRCWGKGKENPFNGSNITIANGDELVSISERDGKLIIHEFIRSEKTSLGLEVRDVLLKNNLPVDGNGKKEG